MSDWTCRDCGRAGDDCSLKAIFSLEDTYYVCIGGWASECKDKVTKDALHCLERYLTTHDEQFIMDAIGVLKGD